MMAPVMLLVVSRGECVGAGVVVPVVPLDAVEAAVSGVEGDGVGVLVVGVGDIAEMGAEGVVEVVDVGVVVGVGWL